MSALAARQRELFAALFAPEPPRDRGLAVYRHGALANLGNALAATFPVVRRLVGAAFFGEAARRHALAVASTSGDLDDYGAEFPGFLESYPHAAGLPYLADVARLEWAAHEARRAPDAPALDPASLPAVAEEDARAVRLPLHASARLVRSPFPVLALWEANQPDRDGTPDREAGSDRVLVFRVADGLRLEALDEPEWRVAAALRNGGTLEAACEALGADAEAFPRALARLARLGALGAWELASRT